MTDNTPRDGLYSFLAFLALAVSIAIPFTWAHGGFLGLTSNATWLCSMGAFTGMFVFFGMATNGKPYGVLIDETNSISLSRFQLVIWSIVLLSALLCAGIFNTATGPYKPPLEMMGPLDIVIPPEIWALLGLGTFTAIAGPAIARSRLLKSEIVALARSPKSSDLIVDPFEEAKAGNSPPADIAMVQLLALTMLLVVIYVLALYNIFDVMVGDSKQPISAFPGISEGFLALLGISHTAFLANKISKGRVGAVRANAPD